MGRPGSHGTLARSVSREYLLSFLVCFLFFFVIFFVNQMLIMAETILQKRAPFMDVLSLLVYSAPYIIGLSFPFASLVAGLMTVGRLSSDNELMIMQASGVPLRKLFLPFVLVGALISGGSFVMNDLLMPIGTVNFAKLYRKLLLSTPALELDSWSVKKDNKSTIITGEVEGGVIRDVVIFDVTEERKPRVIMAKSARIDQGGEAAEAISLDLEDVFVQLSDPQKPDRFEYSTSARMVYNIMIKGYTDSIPSIGPKEMSSVDLARAIDKKREAEDDRERDRRKRLARERLALEQAYFAHGSGAAQGGSQGASIENSMRALEERLRRVDQIAREDLDDKSLQLYEMQYWKKFSIPFGALCFVFFAFPVGQVARRSGRMVGFGLGLILSFFYWALLWGAETLGARLQYPAALAMWMPDIVVLGLSGIAFAARRGSH